LHRKVIVFCAGTPQWLFPQGLVNDVMRRVLIVDDSPTIRKMVRASLRPLPAVDFLEAATGLEAIEQLALGGVELIVLDLNMPDMHGIDVLKFVRSQPRFARLPIIVLTTRGDEQSRQTAFAAGATSYVTKPFAPQSLAGTASLLLNPTPGHVPAI